MLKGFRRIGLQPGETKTVTIPLDQEHLALYDRNMRRVLEPGTFTAFVGGSSTALPETQFQVIGDTVVLAPPPPRPQ